MHFCELEVRLSICKNYLIRNQCICVFKYEKIFVREPEMWLSVVKINIRCISLSVESAVIYAVFDSDFCLMLLTVSQHCSNYVDQDTKHIYH